MSLSALSALLAASDGGATVWMPPQGSEQAAPSDDLYYFIYWLCVAFFVSIVAMTFIFAWQYRRKTPTQAPQPSISHHTLLEIAWSAIPLLLAIYIFYIGFRDFLMLRTPPTNAYTVDVTGQKWSWSFSYPGGVAPDDGKLHVPAGEPVKLVMHSKDVLHAFYIPDFRVKQDLVPGRYTDLWFTAKAPADGADTAEVHFTCAEYCGTSHSDMHGKVIVHKDRASFDTWLAAQGNQAISVKWGKELYERNCKVCHLLDKDFTGPNWNDLSQRYLDKAERPLHGGGSAKVDQQYVRDSIVTPAVAVVEGFGPTSAMPTFKGQLKDNAIESLILYIRSLKDPTVKDADQAPGGAGTPQQPEQPTPPGSGH